jgi:hypothetical protein
MTSAAKSGEIAFEENLTTHPALLEFSVYAAKAVVAPVFTGYLVRCF